MLIKREDMRVKKYKNGKKAFCGGGLQKNLEMLRDGEMWNERLRERLGEKERGRKREGERERAKEGEKRARGGRINDYVSKQCSVSLHS